MTKNLPVSDPTTVAEIYADGSCHTQYRVGAWVAVLLIGPVKKMISGVTQNTTHNKMELVAVIRGIEYLKIHYRSIRMIKIYSDSQFVIGLTARNKRLTSFNFYSKKGKQLENADLMKDLLKHTSSFATEFVKVKAHQKNTDALNYNRVADKIARKLVRAMNLQHSNVWMNLPE